jgi:hypothetical protein
MLHHRDLATLHAGLDHILQSPTDHGSVQLIVRRPAEDQRETLTRAQLDTTAGLLGDNWRTRGTDPVKQITLMNARVAALVAATPDRWELAGDQLYVDLDLSCVNLPAGTRLAIGGTIIEVSAEPHRGCKKFAARFGVDALRFVNSPRGDELRLRGLNAQVLQTGTVHVCDTVQLLAHHGDAPRHAA